MSNRLWHLVIHLPAPATRWGGLLLTTAVEGCHRENDYVIPSQRVHPQEYRQGKVRQGRFYSGD